GDTSAQAALLNDAEFLGVLRHDRLWVHSPNVTGDSLSLITEYYDEARKAKVLWANNLNGQLKELIEQLRSRGVEVIISNDGRVELKSLTAVEDRVAKLIEARTAARKAKNFAEADRIRDELAAMGVQLKDSKDPV